MHEPITEFPKGSVMGCLKIVKGSHTIEVTRLGYGSRTRFVEKVTHTSERHGPRVTSFKKTDDFQTTKSADRFISTWLKGKIDIGEYRVIHKDKTFDQTQEAAPDATPST